jgi:putative SOS response-associated peptidase YedK
LQTPASGGKKSKRLLTRTDGDFLALAGLYDTWKTPEGKDLRSCVIITASPHMEVAPIHDRMPVILTAGGVVFWLSPDETEPAVLVSLLPLRQTICCAHRWSDYYTVGIQREYG